MAELEWRQLTWWEVTHTTQNGWQTPLVSEQEPYTLNTWKAVYLLLDGILTNHSLPIYISIA